MSGVRMSEEVLRATITPMQSLIISIASYKTVGISRVPYRPMCLMLSVGQSCQNNIWQSVTPISPVLQRSCILPQCTCPEFHNAPFWNRNVHISVTKWCIVGYLVMHCGICEMGSSTSYQNIERLMFHHFHESCSQTTPLSSDRKKLTTFWHVAFQYYWLVWPGWSGLNDTLIFLSILGKKRVGSPTNKRQTPMGINSILRNRFESCFGIKSRYSNLLINIRRFFVRLIFIKRNRIYIYIYTYI